MRKGLYLSAPMVVYAYLFGSPVSGFASGGEEVYLVHHAQTRPPMYAYAVYDGYPYTSLDGVMEDSHGSTPRHNVRWFYLLTSAYGSEVGKRIAFQTYSSRVRKHYE